MSDPALQLDPALVEETVLLATDASAPGVKRRYREERDALYDIGDPDEREASFRELDARWFDELDLGAPLRRLLRECGSICSRVAGCTVFPARRKKEEGADLQRVRGASIPTLVVKLTPASLLELERVSRLLRNELLHVEDMLDPDFGYDMEIPSVSGGTSYENLLRNRYRILWNTTVDGRLAARGLLSQEDVLRARREFSSAFPSAGEGDFEHFFRTRRPTHREILAFAMDASETCPLCELPMSAAPPLELPPAVEAAIRSDFPGWDSSRAVCRQCADLYGSRAHIGTSPGC